MVINSFTRSKLRTGLHILFWCLSFYLLLNFFSFEDSFSKVDFLYCVLFHFFLITAVYISLYVLLPFTGIKEKWFLYIILNVVLILLLSWLNVKFFNDWSALLFPGYYFISYLTWLQIAGIISVYIGLSTLLKLSKAWFSINDLERRLLEAEKEKMNMELRGLKSQINPHFFFNTLNGLYALSLQNNPVLPSSILQLSGLMRYFIYNSKEEKVSLEQEIAMVKDYIGLMKLRSDNKQEVCFKVSGDIEGRNIAPLIFISFLENAFKHGLHTVDLQAGIELSVSITESKILFTIRNKKSHIVDNFFENSGGIGLENVKRRLSLIYPGKHILEIKNSEHEYDVFLEINDR